jgi:hypothetical protein
MAFSDYTRRLRWRWNGNNVLNDLSNLNPSPFSSHNDFLVIRRIEALVNSAGLPLQVLIML